MTDARIDWQFTAQARLEVIEEQKVRIAALEEALRGLVKAWDEATNADDTGLYAVFEEIKAARALLDRQSAQSARPNVKENERHDV